jgi:PAS domain S-box-containing protein
MSRPLRVLLIEDSDDDAALLLRELHRAGYEPESRRVDTAPALEQALDASWDLILCDYRMPTLDALSAVTLVRGRQVDTPFIIVSGTVGEEHAVAALRSGAQDFVLKGKLTRLGPAIERELRDSETRIKRALAESTLEATEASFRSAFELIPDGVLVCKQGRVVHANAAAASMLGAKGQDELLDRPLPDLFAQSDQQGVRERMQETQGSQAAVSFGELTMVRRDGGLINVETTAMSVLFDGEAAILGIIRDVTARRDLVARSMQVDRMLAVGTLAAGVGHEINNPLAYVMANVAYATDQAARIKRRLQSLAGQDSSIDAAVTELSEMVSVLSEVDEGTRRIRDIARDLNTFARNDEELRPVDLRAVADSALRMAAPEFRQRARIVRQYEAVPPVRASVSRVSQVLLNLLINAAHSIEKGAYESNEVAVHVRSESSKVVVEVRDTGCGIPAEHLDRVFTPFFTTKPVGQGTGLGLSISRRIVDSLGGQIDVESSPGRGTTMRVVLPAVLDTSSEDVPTHRPSASRGRVLFIDDERLVGTAFQRAFSREHDVIVVESAAEALARLEGGESFDAIFCDANMPVITGADFFEKIEQSWPRLRDRVVIVTGGLHERRTRDLLLSRKTPILEKPLHVDQVRALLAQILSGGRPLTDRR